MFENIIRQGKLLYSFSPKVQKLVKKATTSPFYYQIAKEKIKRQKLKDATGPFNLVIETSNFCNAACLMCPYRKMKRRKKIMEKKVFAQLLTRIKKEKLPINKVFFSGLGEPLTDPNLIERIRAIKNLGVPVRLYTNASLLRPGISGSLVEMGLEEINISFNGTTPSEYQKIMGLDFGQTVKNIKNLMKVKNREVKRLPWVQTSLITLKENQKSLDRHLKNWQGKVDSVTVSLAHQWGGRVRISSKSKVQSSKLTYPCRSLWHTLVIDSSGNFVICCRDFESRYVLGNIQTHSFAQIFKSAIISNFRSLHLEFLGQKLPKICQNCNFPYQDGIDWFLPRSLD